MRSNPFNMIKFKSLAPVLAATLAVSSIAHAAKLDDSELTSLRQSASEGDSSTGDHWTDRFQMGGHAAAGFIEAGPAINEYRRKNFVVHEFNVFIKVTPSKGTSALVELYPILFMPSFFNGINGYVGEAYLQFKDAFMWGNNNSVSFKIGRFDVPFGTDYMRQDAVDNPIISKPVSWLWAFDEGLMINTKLGKLGTSVAITDGAMSRQLDDSGAKTYTAKGWVDVTPNLLLVASGHWMGPHNSHAMYQGQKLLSDPLIPGAPTTAKLSTGRIYELSGTYKRDRLTTHFNAGRVYMKSSNEIKRQLTYYSVEPIYMLTEKTYAAAMYSAYGTFSHDLGHTISDSLGNNIDKARSLSRIALAVGHKLNYSTTLKAEIMKDKLMMIDGLTNPGNGRLAVGVQAAIKF